MPNANPKNEVACALFDFTIPEGSYQNPEELCTHLNKWAKKWVFQLEQGEGENGYRHYQGRCSLIKKKRMTPFINNPHVQECFPGAHWSITNNTVHQSQNFNYVLKEDTKIEGPWSDAEYETPPKLTRQLVEFQNIIETTGYYPWQADLLPLVERTENRFITYICDFLGNNGKSQFAEWLVYKGKACGLPTMVNMEDIMQAVMGLKKSPCYMIDMPRAMKKDKLHQFYSGIEELKNGRAYDKRYNFTQTTFDRPQIVVFSNSFPDFNALSSDRWQVYVMQPDKSMKLIPQSMYRRYGFADDYRRGTQAADIKTEKTQMFAQMKTMSKTLSVEELVQACGDMPDLGLNSTEDPDGEDTTSFAGIGIVPHVNAKKRKLEEVSVNEPASDNLNEFDPDDSDSDGTWYASDVD